VSNVAAVPFGALVRVRLACQSGHLDREACGRGSNHPGALP
jgi:hypothetical protein